MRIARWTPPVAPTRQAQFLLKRLDRVRKLLGLLRLHRHELYDTFQDELATTYRATGAGRDALPPREWPWRCWCRVGCLGAETPAFLARVTIYLTGQARKSYCWALALCTAVAFAFTADSYGFVPTKTATTSRGRSAISCASIGRPPAANALCNSIAYGGAVWKLRTATVTPTAAKNSCVAGFVVQPASSSALRRCVAYSDASPSPSGNITSTDPFSGAALSAFTSRLVSVVDRVRGLTRSWSLMRSRSALAARSRCCADNSSSLSVRSPASAALVFASAERASAVAICAADSALNRASWASFTKLTRFEKYHANIPASAASAVNATAARPDQSAASSSKLTDDLSFWILVVSALVVVFSALVVIVLMAQGRRGTGRFRHASAGVGVSPTWSSCSLER